MNKTTNLSVSKTLVSSLHFTPKLVDNIMHENVNIRTEPQ